MSPSGMSLGIVLQTEIDPNVVRPGWTPLLITALLLLALVFLFFSMRKQIRKIHVPDDDERAADLHDTDVGEADVRTPVDESAEKTKDELPPESR